MTVKDIVIMYLKDRGYTGLFNEYGCGCGIDDLFCCDCVGVENCEVGYREPCSAEEGAFHTVLVMGHSCPHCIGDEDGLEELRGE